MIIEAMGMSEIAQRVWRVSEEVGDPSQIPKEPITLKEHTQERNSIQKPEKKGSARREENQERVVSRKAQGGRRGLKNEEVFPGVRFCWEVSEIRTETCPWGLTTGAC